MRIIGGFHRGRQIDAPEGLTTRPMTDRVRENLFNLLRDEVPEAVVLDVFCGSGALGLEALSRGAATCTFVDADEGAIQAVGTNCERLGLSKQARILRRDALRPGTWLRPAGAAAYTVIFIDPPYVMTAEPSGQARLAGMIAEFVRIGLVAPNAAVMIRTERDVQIPLPWEGFIKYDERSYGSTTLYLMMYKGTP